MDEPKSSIDNLAEQYEIAPYIVRDEAELIAQKMGVSSWTGMALDAESICLMALNDDACYHAIYNKCEEHRILKGDKTKAAPQGVIKTPGTSYA